MDILSFIIGFILGDISGFLLTIIILTSRKDDDD